MGTSSGHRPSAAADRTAAATTGLNDEHDGNSDESGAPKTAACSSPADPATATDMASPSVAAHSSPACWSSRSGSTPSSPSPPGGTLGDPADRRSTCDGDPGRLGAPPASVAMRRGILGAVPVNRSNCRHLKSV